MVTKVSVCRGKYIQIQIISKYKKIKQIGTGMPTCMDMGVPTCIEEGTASCMDIDMWPGASIDK